MQIWVPNTPTIIRRALTLSFASLCLLLFGQFIGVYFTHLDYSDLHKDALPYLPFIRISVHTFTLLLLAMFSSIHFLILFVISRRKIWARILWLVLFVLRLAVYIYNSPSFSFPNSFSDSVNVFNSLISTLTDLYMFYACFFGKGHLWFKK